MALGSALSGLEGVYSSAGLSSSTNRTAIKANHGLSSDKWVAVGPTAVSFGACVWHAMASLWFPLGICV